ncbi:unnamed protein product [Linum trigynum]
MRSPPSQSGLAEEYGSVEEFARGRKETTLHRAVVPSRSLRLPALPHLSISNKGKSGDDKGRPGRLFGMGIWGFCLFRFGNGFDKKPSALAHWWWVPERIEEGGGAAAAKGIRRRRRWGGDSSAMLENNEKKRGAVEALDEGMGFGIQRKQRR